MISAFLDTLDTVTGPISTPMFAVGFAVLLITINYRIRGGVK